MLSGYNLPGRGYRYSDFRNVCSSLSEAAGRAFVHEYERLYFEKHGHARTDEERAERQIDEVASLEQIDI